MNIPDFINGLFEFSGAIAGAVNCVVLFRHKKVRGFSPALSVYFVAWGLWNCYYYPLLSQWISTVGTIAITLSNGLYAALAVYYSRKEKHESGQQCRRLKGSGESNAE